MTLAAIEKAPIQKFDQRVNDSSLMAWNCLNQASTFLSRLREDAVINMVTTQIGDGWPDAMENVVTMDTTPPGKPTLPTPTIEVPKKDDLYPIVVQTFPVPKFEIKDPGVVIPGAPTVIWPTEPGSAPALDDVTVPSAPTITLPDVPPFHEIAVPNRPEYLAVTWDAVRPNIHLEAPGNLFVFQEQPYSSDVREALMEKVLNDIRNGGTGLGAEVEQAIWDRAKIRLEEDLDAKVTELRDTYAAMGCSRPSGPMLAAEARLREDFNRRLSDLNRDILTKQAELAQTNTQQAMDLGLKLENILVDFHNKIMDRAFLAAKEVATSAVVAFKAEVEAYNLQLDQYKTDAAVYEQKVRGNLATLEQYKTLIEAGRLEADIQAKAIDLYNAQLKGAMSLIEIYKTEMEGAKLKSEVQVQRLTAYKAQIEAYVSRVNANTSRFQAFSAQVAGEKAKADVYEAQVGAYTSQVKAVEAAANAESSRARALADANKSIVDGYQSDIARYKADVDYAMKVQENYVALYRSEVEGFGQKVRAVDSHNDTQYKKYTSYVDRWYKRSQSILEEAKHELTRQIEVAKTLSENSKAGATVYAQALAASMSTMNTSVRLGYDESVSNQASESTSIQTSV